MSCRGIWPREATPTAVTTVQAAHAAIARYVAGGPTMSWVGWGVSVRKDQGPRCPSSGPMIVCTAPPATGLAIMLRRGSLPPTPCIEASLMAHSPPLSSDPVPLLWSRRSSAHPPACAVSRPATRHAAHVRRSLLLGGLDHTCRVLLLGQRLPIGSIGTVERHTERHTGRHQHFHYHPGGDGSRQEDIAMMQENDGAPNAERDKHASPHRCPSWTELFGPHGR